MAFTFNQPSVEVCNEWNIRGDPSTTYKRKYKTCHFVSLKTGWSYTYYGWHIVFNTYINIINVFCLSIWKRLIRHCAEVEVITLWFIYWSVIGLGARLVTIHKIWHITQYTSLIYRSWMLHARQTIFTYSSWVKSMSTFVSFFLYPLILGFFVIVVLVLFVHPLHAKVARQKRPPTFLPIRQYKWLIKCIVEFLNTVRFNSKFIQSYAEFYPNWDDKRFKVGLTSFPAPLMTL